MTSAWVAGIFAAIGAMVGAAATLMASWIPSRAQRQIELNNRKERVAEILRIASAEYLAAVDGFIDSARELVYQIAYQASGPDRDSVRKAYLAEWQKVQRRCAVVTVAGPADLAERAEELKGSLGTMAKVCDRWYEAVKHGPVNSRAGQFDAAWESADEVRIKFAATARIYTYERAQAGR
jgi:hypothetical protein